MALHEISFLSVEAAHETASKVWISNRPLVVDLVIVDVAQLVAITMALSATINHDPSIEINLSIVIRQDPQHCSGNADASAASGLPPRPAHKDSTR